mgnify:CR=1 FL=1
MRVSGTLAGPSESGANEAFRRAKGADEWYNATGCAVSISLSILARGRMLTKLTDLAAARWTLTAAPAAAGPRDSGPDPALREALRSGVPATVPGAVHTDLLAAGLIEDPYGYDAETRLAWIGHTDWTYTATFDFGDDAIAHDRLDLACDGLDTFATLTLNGAPLGTTRNMHRRYRFDLRGAARAGANELSIRFAAPVPAAFAAEAAHGGPLPHKGHGSNAAAIPHNMVRKMACSYGWDWGPMLPSAGVWRGIRVEAWNAARMTNLRPAVTEATAKRATVELSIDLERAADAAPPTVRVVLAGPDGKTVFGPADCTVEAHTARVTLTVPDPQRWWPVGHGEHPRYTLSAALLDAEGRLLQTDTRRIGLRTVALDTSPDAVSGAGAAVDGLPSGETMTLRVNGKAVFLKGGNWIPDDCFPARSETPARLRERVDQLIAAHGNCLRVWGGGVYACDELLEHCDATGVLVWQDFMFACAGYPEDDAYAAEVEAEARDNVARLASHPSVVIYNGNNECIWSVFEWAEPFLEMGRNTAERGWGLKYWLELLPRVVAELDPSRPYWPASPYSGTMDRQPNDNACGNRHVWNVWFGDGAYRNYLEHFPRMATEFGYHGPAHAATLLPHVPDAQRAWDSDALKYYNRNDTPESGQEGQALTDLRMGDDFDPPRECFDDWLYLAQVMQARALEMGCSWFRALSPWCGAAVYWQWNDCWPVSSWSAVDGGGRPKPLWFATRRFFAPRLLTIKPREPKPEGGDIGPVALYLHNDTDVPWTGPLTARRVDLTGATIDTLDLTADVPARGTRRLGLPGAWADRPGDTALVVRSADAAIVDAWWWFTPDKRLAYPAADLDVVVTPTGNAGDATLTVTARSFVRDLCFFPDRLHPGAAVSDNLLTLLPGDVTGLTLTSPVPLDAAVLTSAPVMQSVNRFGAAT